MNQINWIKAITSGLLLVCFLVLPFAVWGTLPDILFNFGWTFLRSDGALLLSPGGVFVTMLAGAVCAIPFVVTMLHIFSEWDFFAALARKFPADNPEHDDPKPGNWQ